MAYQPTTQMTQVNVAAGTTPVGVSRPWKHGFCSCLGDCGTSLLTWCFPCITYGQNKTALNPDASCFCNALIYYCLMGCSLCWIPATSNRGEIRAKYNIEGSGLEDCMAHFCCTCCALVQEARELKG
ncbi:hypothetical protein Glove_99g355 [Diversispora epigaea]|uniref:PLAC8-domain-containing protein n=1 Tax=Diversispora epigaea TaxID=1348612 RepID=A0A397J6M0_9GLOM|nr:hypothetical protein Glove_99g355 [Diversispora epigaea]